MRPPSGLPVPVLLVAGFLGAGKTTLVNHVLANPQGRRIAAVVNDFGAINIDADLVAGTADGVVSLKNGCICCTLQGDLLRTLGSLLRRDPPPDAIIIETSGVSDPEEIKRALLDPIIFREAALDAVIGLADARHLTDRPGLLRDPLCQSQLRAADFIALNKTDLVTVAELAALRQVLSALKPARAIVDVRDGAVPAELLFSAALHGPAAPGSSRRALPASPRFQSLSWTSIRPLSLQRFQDAMGRLSQTLLRAKGILLTAEHPGRPLLFQLVGTRATIAPAPPLAEDQEAVRLVLISEPGALDEAAILALLQGCVV